jgi:hypothetical protein
MDALQTSINKLKVKHNELNKILAKDEGNLFGQLYIRHMYDIVHFTV